MPEGGALTVRTMAWPAGVRLEVFVLRLPFPDCMSAGRISTAPFRDGIRPEAQMKKTAHVGQSEAASDLLLRSEVRFGARMGTPLRFHLSFAVRRPVPAE